MQQHQYDVIIVGAGGAGMRAALESSKRTRTAVLTKLYPTRSHTGAAQGGMCAALANVEEDNWEWHTFDTVKGGDYLVDQDAAEVMCQEAIDAVLDLEKMGLPFNRTAEGKIDQRRFGGHTRNHGEAAVRRSCFAADRTGHMILQTLYQQCIKQNVEFFNEFYVLDLLMTDGKASGVVAYELATGELHVFSAKSVIFASGGFGKVFRTTSNAHTLTGDGMGIVWRKGLPLEDMEFFQFHPTGLAGLGVLLSEAARGEGGILRNKDNERFMERYAPTVKDLAPRDMVARAMANEVREGRGCGPDGDYVFLDLTHLRAGAHRREAAGHHRVRADLPRRRAVHRADPGLPDRALRDGRHPDQHQGRGAGRQRHRRSPACTPRARSPACPCTARTAWARTRCSTSTCSAGGPGSRPPSTPRPRSSRSCRTTRRRTSSTWSRDCATPPGASGSRRSGRDLQATMDLNAQVYRTEGSLKQALVDIEALKLRFAQVGVQDKGKRFNTDLLEAVELGFLLDLAEVLVVSALARKESRGGHFREDYATRDDVNFMRHTMAYREVDAEGNENIRLDYKPVVQTRYKPMERKY